MALEGSITQARAREVLGVFSAREILRHREYLPLVAHGQAVAAVLLSLGVGYYNHIDTGQANRVEDLAKELQDIHHRFETGFKPELDSPITTKIISMWTALRNEVECPKEFTAIGSGSEEGARTTSEAESGHNTSLTLAASSAQREDTSLKSWASVSNLGVKARSVFSSVVKRVTSCLSSRKPGNSKISV